MGDDVSSEIQVAPSHGAYGYVWRGVGGCVGSWTGKSISLDVWVCTCVKRHGYSPLLYPPVRDFFLKKQKVKDFGFVHSSFLFPFYVAYEKAVREKRLQAEISKARKEAADYLERVDRSKMIESMQERRAAAAAAGGGGGAAAAAVKGDMGDSQSGEHGASKKKKKKVKEHDAMVSPTTTSTTSASDGKKERHVRQRKVVQAGSGSAGVPQSLLDKVREV